MGFEFITCEACGNEFVRHRVALHFFPHITCNDSRISSERLQFQDLSALLSHLKFNRCLANQFVAASYSAAFEFISAFV